MSNSRSDAEFSMNTATLGEIVQRRAKGHASSNHDGNREMENEGFTKVKSKRKGKAGEGPKMRKESLGKVITSNNPF